jgi:outer membrane lipoprotein LolB
VKRCLGIALSLLIASCAVAPTTDTVAQQRWMSRQAALAGWNAWQLNGRVALHYDDEGWHASLIWQQQPGAYRLRLIGPLGQGAVELNGDAQEVVLREANGSVRVSRDAETLLQDALGWSLPVSGLYYWVRGLPDPGVPAGPLRLDAMGRMVALNQSGWEIRYDGYDEAGGRELPTRISLRSGAIRVRLIIDDWRAA